MATGSRRTAAIRCGSCGAALRAKNRFCPSCGTPVATPGVTLPLLPEVTRSAPPRPTPSASLQVGGTQSHALEEQRKLITVLFIDLAGSTSIAERLDPEDLRTVLSVYFNVTSRRIVQFGGTIDKYIGDAVMAVVGAPVAHEDDAARSIDAALAIQADMRLENDELDRRYGVRLTLRTGINTGEVVAGMLSGHAQSGYTAYTVTGDTVNTAQRLEAAAPHGEILVSEGTRARRSPCRPTACSVRSVARRLAAASCWSAARPSSRGCSSCIARHRLARGRSRTSTARPGSESRACSPSSSTDCTRVSSASALAAARTRSRRPTR